MTDGRPSALRLVINGEETDSASENVSGLIEELGLENRRVAVMVNDVVVRRRNFDSHGLAENDRVEIISLIGGG